jgi:mRNA-degrading endonuclease RelE of RelBE toxin-antitoxin system
MVVLVTGDFKKSFDKLKDKAAKERLLNVIHKLENADSLNSISNVKAIINHADLYRIRIGDYRLLFSHERNTIEVLLLEYLKRDKNTYKYI